MQEANANRQTLPAGPTSPTIGGTNTEQSARHCPECPKCDDRRSVGEEIEEEQLGEDPPTARIGNERADRELVGHDKVISLPQLLPLCDAHALVSSV